MDAHHGVRLALASVGAGVLLVALTGDIASVSDLAAGLPALLIQQGYSRDFEREADAWALAWMQRACVAPRRYVAIMEALTRGQARASGFFDSHPGTGERLAAFRDAPDCP